MEKKKDGSDFVWSLFVIVLIVFIYVSICTGFGVELTKIFIYSLFSIFAIMCFIVFVFEFYLGINEFFIRIKDVFLWVKSNSISYIIRHYYRIICDVFLWVKVNFLSIIFGVFVLSLFVLPSFFSSASYRYEYMLWENIYLFVVFIVLGFVPFVFFVLAFLVLIAKIIDKVNRFVSAIKNIYRMIVDVFRRTLN